MHRQSPGPEDGAAPAAAPAPEHALEAALATAGRGTLAERMGIELVEVSAQRVVARMPVAGNTQPYGLLHGGASVALAETVGSIGSAVHAGADRVAVGLDINATHHRAVRTGFVTAVATAVHLGRTTTSYAVQIVDDAGRLVCTSRISCLVRDRTPGRAAGAGQA